MSTAFSSLMDRVRSPEGRKALKYTAVSVISVAVSQVALIILLGVVRWTARSSNIAAVGIGGVPSYYLNRTWAWGKRGRSHFMKEIVPFWTLALIGLIFSTWTADFAETYAKDRHYSHPVLTVTVAGAALAAFGVLWIVKFIIFNKFLFVEDEDLRAALADEIVA